MTVEGTTHAFDSNINQTLNTHRASGMPRFNDDQGGNLAVTSTNIEIFSNGMKIGFVQSLTPSESRQIAKVQELGTEGVVQSVPYNTRGGQIEIARLAVYNSNLYNALGNTRSGQFVDAGQDEYNSFQPQIISESGSGNATYSNPFKTLKDQRVPLEFQVKTKMPSKVESYLVETYVDCWLASYSKTIASNTITISESATVQYSDVLSQYATS